MDIDYMTDRPREGERCSCGRLASVVYITEDHGRVPDCGIRDGGANRDDQEVPLTDH